MNLVGSSENCSGGRVIYPRARWRGDIISTLAVISPVTDGVDKSRFTLFDLFDGTF